ncbi:MAG: helix-turn-helix transcriptional regulator, partial [Actinobacteria bacterium]|nr:helix-turn-helix transcriptional regulator [Actinomycetota bacterium]
MSRGRIVGAAIEVADVDGLAGVSMSKVAARLGFTTVSLYRHVRNKDELILLMQDAAVGAPPERAEPAPDGGARSWSGGRGESAGINRHEERDENARHRRSSDPRWPRVMRWRPVRAQRSV